MLHATSIYTAVPTTKKQGKKQGKKRFNSSFDIALLHCALWIFGRFGSFVGFVDLIFIFGLVHTDTSHHHHLL